MDDKLHTVDTQIIVEKDGEAQMRSLESLGNTQYTKFVEQRIVSNNLSIFDPIKRNNINIFGGTTTCKSKQATKLSITKSDAALFSQLYIACQHR